MFKHFLPSEGTSHLARTAELLMCLDLDPATLIEHASQLYSQYELSGRIEALDEAIALARDVLSCRTPGHMSRSVSLNKVGFYLSTRYRQLGQIEDLNEAIVLGQDALSLCPPGNSLRPTCLSNLACYLSIQYDQLGEIADLDKAIVLGRDSLVLCTPGHTLRPTSLNNVALYLSTRYKQLGNIEDLNEAIVLGRDSVSLCPPGHPLRPTSLNNIGIYLSTRYKQLGGVDDLDEAIAVAREALSLCTPGHPLRAATLNNLSNNLFTHYKQGGGIDDLDEAIVLCRDSLSLCSPEGPVRSTSLTSVACYLMERYQLLGGMDDLDEAILLARDALSLCPSGHSLRPTSLSNIALCLTLRYQQLGEINDLDEAIVLGREAVSLCPSGNQFRSTSLINIANHLSVRYQRLGVIDDLNEAISHGRDALSLCPPGHPDRSTSLESVALRLSARYLHLRGIDDLNEAILLCRDALELCQPGNPLRSATLENLAEFYSTRFTHLGQVDDKQILFNLYAELEHVSQTVSSLDLSAAKQWINSAEHFHHPTTILAYETALRLFVEHLTALPSLPQHLTVLKSFSSSLAADAFSACLRNQSLTKAVELLEQGRGVFWSQLTRLRSPLDDVITSGPAGKELADNYARLTSLIRIALHSPASDQHDRVCRLNLELQKLVSKIRALPTLSRFLLPSLFSDLRYAASGGPVIIVNASKYGCDALVVFADKDPVHIPLSVSREDVRDMSFTLHALTKSAKMKEPRDKEVEKSFMAFLRQLWDMVVSHIIDLLQTVCPRGSRIWWCPTAEFSLLPLHAAAPYRKGKRGVSDLYISSYTTTFTALIRARRPSPTKSKNEKTHFIAIGQAQATGADELPSVSIELANIGHLVDGPAQFSSIEGAAACIPAVTHELTQNEWVHFACHGIPNQTQPFESAFALHDGRFTIQRIIQCDLQNPEFAYLSACQTTVGDNESPDEVIHLASAMQFVGFRSVIGTMLAVDDSETDKVTSAFYKLMVHETDSLDHTRAAQALRRALRTVDLPMDQRILYIHLGA